MSGKRVPGVKCLRAALHACVSGCLQVCKHVIGAVVLEGKGRSQLGVQVLDNLRIDLDNLTSEDRTGGSVGL